jgi:hypothetical protein
MISAVQLQYQITLAEFKEMAWLRHRSSLRWMIGLCFGALVFIAGATLFALGDRGLSLVLILLSPLQVVVFTIVSSLTIRWTFRRNSRMFGPRTVTIDETGISSDHALGHNEAKWSSYQDFKETKNLFLLYHSADLIGILPKRAFASQAELEQFRALVTSKIPRG